MMFKVLRNSLVPVLLIPVISLSANAQAVIDYTWGGVGKSILDAEQRRVYGNDKCYGLLSSAWNYYGSSPPASAIRGQRKYETRYGCPHLYEVDGTVNRVRGINDSGSFSSSSNSRSSSHIPYALIRNFANSLQELPEPLQQKLISQFCSDDSVYQKVKVNGNRSMSYEELVALRRELRC